jgi:hypothetical protein
VSRPPIGRRPVLTEVRPGGHTGLQARHAARLRDPVQQLGPAGDPARR